MLINLHVEFNMCACDKILILIMATQKKKNKLGKRILPSCKIHIMEEEILDGGPKGGGKEKKS